MLTATHEIYFALPNHPRVLPFLRFVAHHTSKEIAARAAALVLGVMTMIRLPRR